MKHSPEVRSRVAAQSFQGVFFIVFIVVALVIFMGALSIGAPGPFLLAPLAFVLIGVAMFIASIRKGVDFSRAPLKRVPAAVAGERSQVSGGGQNTSASTSYFVTLEFKGGRRKEYSAGDELAGKLSAGDIGVAYLKGRVLVDFRRVRL
jgi:uncharacterized protein (DUF58 family)